MTLGYPTVTMEKHAADIRAILDDIAAAWRAREAKAIARHYVPDARTADLAPTLPRRGSISWPSGLGSTPAKEASG